MSLFILCEGSLHSVRHWRILGTYMVRFFFVVGCSQLWVLFVAPLRIGWLQLKVFVLFVRSC